MRFWKFIKDELIKNQNKQDLQNNDSSEDQEISDSQSQQSEEQDMSDSNSQQGDSQEQQDSNNNQNDQLDNEKNSSNESNNNESNSSEDQEISDSQSQQSEEQDMSDSQSQQGDSQEQQSQSQSSSSEQSQESSQQSSDSQQGEDQDMSDSQSQQGDSQEQQSQLQSSSSEQSQKSSQQPSDSQQSEEQDMSDSNSQQGDSQEQQSQSQSSNSEQSQESSQQPSDSQQSEEQDMSDSQSQQHEECTNDFSNEVEENKDEIENLSEEEIQQTSNEIANDSKLTNEQKRELLEKLKKSIEEIRKRKAEKLQREHINHDKQEVEESKEEKYELSEQTNNFLNQLGELPSFEDRDRGAGYSIDTESYTEVPESIIRTLITRFLNQRFCKHNTDLNIRSNSLEKTNGFYKWEVKDVITHLQTHQVTKVLTDKYVYEYANGKNENVPLSFYFDMSGSMSSYTNMLAVIAIELLKKGVKVLIGFNERVNVQIESIEKNITVSELADILESAGYWNGWGSSGRDDYKKDPRVKFKYIERNIDNYLIEKKAEKCVVFADFDPRSEVINLSQAADVYWFCFESRYDSYDIDDFNGFIYKVQNIRDLEQGLLKVNEKRFETLCYTDNPKSLQKKVRVKR